METNDIHPLKRYRRRHDINQAELADLLSVTPGYISHIERGARGVTAAEARRFEAALNFEVGKEELVFWEFK